MPKALDMPLIKPPSASPNRPRNPLRDSTIKRMTAPNAWPSHSKKPSTCICIVPVSRAPEGRVTGIAIQRLRQGPLVCHSLGALAGVLAGPRISSWLQKPGCELLLARMQSGESVRRTGGGRAVGRVGSWPVPEKWGSALQKEGCKAVAALAPWLREWLSTPAFGALTSAVTLINMDWPTDT